MQVPEVETVFTCTGQGEDITQQQSRFAQLQVKLIERASATAPRPRCEARGAFGADIPGSPAPGRPLAGAGQRSRSSCRSSQRPGHPEPPGHGVDGEAERAGDAGDVTNSGVAGGSGVRIDRQAADLGLTAGQVAQTVRTAYAGSVATRPAGQRGGHLHRDRRAGALTEETRADLRS